jgi:S-DNA-T family DNA segregation ATPase FtsK/SpoIIIE
VAQPASKPKRTRHYQVTLPPLTLLDEPAQTKSDMDDAQHKARIIEETLAHFDVPAKVIETNWGPRVTQFGVEPGYVTRIGQGGEETERKIRVSKISSLNKDLALALAASPIRIEAPVPGRAIVGIEVPNDRLSIVSLRNVMESRTFRRKKSSLKLGLGTGTAGHAIVADLAKMPHLLIAGATGAGKSACINAIAACLLFQNSPLTLRIVMIDPKRVELTSYNGLPHLYGRVEVDVERVVGVLQWLVNEMQIRYQKLADVGARHIDEYNKKWQVGSSEYMPRIVVLIDELADLMFFAPEQVEKSICRLAQMARATGMHLVLATQRPSVDVVTGLIKANFPARIAFAVSTGTDSRVILDGMGAEALLGKGDMLFMSPESSKLVRIQGSFVTAKETARLFRYWTEWADEQEWEQESPPWNDLMDQQEEEVDELLGKAIEIVRQQGSASASMLQRRMHIGYPRAASLIDDMEARGIVGPAEKGGRPREVMPFENQAENAQVSIKEKMP